MSVASTFRLSVRVFTESGVSGRGLGHPYGHKAAPKGWYLALRGRMVGAPLVRASCVVPRVESL